LIFLTKKSIDLNHDRNQWFKSHWFQSANPEPVKYQSQRPRSCGFSCIFSVRDSGVGYPWAVLCLEQGL